ncbi:hypothetical protein C8J57DRAFT_1299757 [Mycena rebaudengoi]|nr:hypothetical protein C8J57DRAFT_1299757 [Mycena rebaudengoi]
MPNNECNERDDKAPKRRVFKCGDRARKPKKTTKPSARSKMGTGEKRAEESKSEKVKGWALDVARQKGAELPRARVGSMRSYKQQLEEIERLRAELTSREAEICRRLSEKQRKWTKKDDVEHGLTDSATEPDSSNDEGQSDVVEDEENVCDKCRTARAVCHRLNGGKPGDKNKRTACNRCRGLKVKCSFCAERV